MELLKYFLWIVRFVFLGMIFIFLYKIIRVMYSDIKGGGRSESRLSAGIEVVKSEGENQIPLGSVYPLHPITNIGRMSDNNIVLESSYVSSHHARIYQRNNSYVIKDMGSTNGTFLNGARINGPTVINRDDLIGIGDVVFKFID